MGAFSKNTEEANELNRTGARLMREHGKRKGIQAYITRADELELEAGHADHDIPREGCPACSPRHGARA